MKGIWISDILPWQHLLEVMHSNRELSQAHAEAVGCLRSQLASFRSNCFWHSFFEGDGEGWEGSLCCDRLWGVPSPTSYVFWQNRANLQPLASLAKNREAFCVFHIFFFFSLCLKQIACFSNWEYFLLGYQSDWLKQFTDALLPYFRYFWRRRCSFNWVYTRTEYWACPASSCKPSWQHFWWPDHGLDGDSGQYCSKVLFYILSFAEGSKLMWFNLMLIVSHVFNLWKIQTQTFVTFLPLQIAGGLWTISVIQFPQHATPLWESNILLLLHMKTLRQKGLCYPENVCRKSALGIGIKTWRPWGWFSVLKADLVVNWR